MPKFTYKAIDRHGTIVQGELEAKDDTVVYNQLQAKRLSAFEIKEASESFQLLKLNKRIKPKDLSRYIRQLSTLLNAGVTLLEALKSLSRSNAHPALAKASDNIRKDLRAGNRLSTAIETHLPMLPRYVPRLAELGEATGQSAKALSDAADRLEFEDNIRNEIRTALSYPTFLASVGTLIVFLMFLFVVPRFGALISDDSDNLPVLSRIVINTGTAMSENIILVLGIGMALAVGGIMAFRSQKARQKIRATMEKAPLIGPMLIEGELGGWARTVGIALDNGADLLSALNLGEYGLNSEKLRRGFHSTRVEIRAGRNIDEVLLETVPEFDPLANDLIRTGRISGSLAEMLLFIGKTQEDQTRERAKRLAAVAEPIAILLISLIVGTIVISIVLAMTSLYDFAI